MNILDSIREPILVADTNHITIYMNKSAVNYYLDGKSLINKSLLDCHNEESKIQMIEIFDQMISGLEVARIILSLISAIPLPVISCISSFITSIISELIVKSRR